MNEIREHEAVRQYLHEVCDQIKAKEVHADVRAELRCHLEEVTEDKMAYGISLDQAVEEALAELGNPVRLGGALHKAHKPKVEWGLLLLMVFFIGLALVAMFSLEASLVTVSQGMILKKELYIGLGIACMIGLYFFDYRKLIPFSWALFIISILGIIVAVSFGLQINGVRSVLRMGIFYFNASESCPYLLVIALAGILQEERWRNRTILIRFALFALLPCYLILLSHSSSALLVYFAGYMAVLLAAKVKWREIVWNLSAFTVFGFLYLLSAPRRMIRIKTFFHPFQAARDDRYMIVHSIEAIQSAGWWGHGFGAVIRSLPGIQAEMIFSYMIYSLGWVMGIVIVVGCILMVSRLLNTAKKVKEDFGKLLILGLTGIFGIQFVWGIAMTIGILPIVSMQLPFIGNGGNQFLLQCCSIGLIASVYRRKDMMARSSKVTAARQR